MDFDYSPRCRELQQRLLAFMETEVYPNEFRFHEEVESNRRAVTPGSPPGLSKS